MKVMAIASPKPGLTPEQLKPHMAGEVPATLKLYLDGKVEQFWCSVRSSGRSFL
jgi:hypothetical protein